MLDLKLPKDIENRLEQLAQKSGRSQSTIVQEAIVEHLETFEDVAEAEERLRKNGQSVSWDEVKAQLFNDDAPQAAKPIFKTKIVKWCD